MTTSSGIYYERYAALLDRVVDLSAPSRTDWVLDLGTGTGNLAGRLATRGAAHVLGLDPSRDMLAIAHRKASREGWPRTSFAHTAAPFLNLPVPDGWASVVVSTFAFHHVAQADKPLAVAEMSRALRPDGRLVLGDVMFRDARAAERALARWPDQLEDEPFALLDVLRPLFADHGLSFATEQVGTITWVVHGVRRPIGPD